MQSMVYKQLPLLKKAGICPFCNEDIISKKNTCIQLYHAHDVKIEEIELDFCEQCSLPFVTCRYKQEFKCYRPFRPVIFQLRNKATAVAVRKRVIQEYICPPKKKRKKRKSNKEKVLLSKEQLIKGDSIDSKHQKIKIETVPEFVTNRCLHCRDYLGRATICIGNTEIVGSICTRCDIYFTTSHNNVEKLLLECKDSNKYMLNGKDSSYYFEKRAKLESEREESRRKMQVIESSVVMVTIRHDCQSPIDYIIVDKTKDVDLAKNILHYTDSFARELLTLIHFPEKLQDQCWQDKQIDVVYPEGKSQWSLHTRIPSDVYIGKDGGYSSSAREGKRFLIDILLYSPYTDKYEIEKATYDQDENYCFMDINKYRNFVKVYGNPYVDLYPAAHSGYISNNWNMLNDESLLKAYGYSVSQKENLSDTLRHDLLAEIVDLNIMTVSRIVYMINYFINTHPGKQNYEARLKWENDLSFIEQYRVNTDRFVIAGNIKKY